MTAAAPAACGRIWGYRDDFTDDASVVEAAGYRVTLVEGDIDNIKITTPLDLAVAEILCADE